MSDIKSEHNGGKVAINQGDHNITIQVEHQEITINSQNPPQKWEEKLTRSYEKKAVFPLWIQWLFAVVAFAADVLSIWSFLLKLRNAEDLLDLLHNFNSAHFFVSLVIFSISMIPIAMAWFLTFKGVYANFVRQHGQIFYIKTKRCAICGGKLKMISVNDGYAFRCQKNKRDHRIDIDFTQL